MRISKLARVRQHDETDCGAACLASVAAHYRYRLPIARIRQYASTDQRGTNVLGMVDAAQRLGFQAKGVKGTFESLAKIPKPAIAHVVTQAGLQHFLVIYAVTSTHVKVMDPGDGKLHRLTSEEFRQQWSGVLILLLPGDQFVAASATTSAGRRFWQLVRPHRVIMLQALVGALVYTILGLSTSIYVQKVVDHVLAGGDTPSGRSLLNIMSTAMFVLLALQLFISTAKSFFALRTGAKIDVELILGYYQHLLRLPQQFFDTMRVGEIISRINDAVKIRTFISDVSINLIVNALVIVFSFTLMFAYYWKLALIMLGVLPLYSLLYYVANRLNRTAARQLMENAADLESQLVESVTTMTTIKQFAIEEQTYAKTEGRFIRFLRTATHSVRTGILTSQSTELINRSFTILLLWLGSTFVLENILTPGELLSFYALLGYLTGPAGSLISANRSIQDALIAAERLFEIVDLEREGTNHTLELTPVMVGDITFSDVSFRYGSRPFTFEGLTLVIPRGKVTAVVGESGSGKTTLLALLQHLYPLTAGTIQIGDYDIRHVSLHSLRHLVGVVPQRIDLFSGSILDNIAVGDFEPDMKRVLSVATMLGITHFVEKLPNGFHTLLSENGNNLSGGQRQRLAIARALYRNPEILILDEATSALDSTSEQFVQQTIKALQHQQKTVIMIAHRLSTVAQADNIVVLEAGKLREQGTHAALLAQRTAYYRLWRQQFPSEVSELLHQEMVA